MTIKTIYSLLEVTKSYNKDLAETSPGKRFAVTSVNALLCMMIVIVTNGWLQCEEENHDEDQMVHDVLLDDREKQKYSQVQFSTGCREMNSSH